MQDSISSEADRLLDLYEKERKTQHGKLYVRNWKLQMELRNLSYQLDRARKFKPEARTVIDETLADQMVSILNYIRQLIVSTVFDIFIQSANSAHLKKV